MTYPVHNVGETPTTDSQILSPGLWEESGFGIEQGRPLGENEQTRIKDHDRLWKFQPTIAARLRAATRKALGRRR